MKKKSLVALVYFQLALRNVMLSVFRFLQREKAHSNHTLLLFFYCVRDGRGCHQCTAIFLFNFFTDSSLWIVTPCEEVFKGFLYITA